MGTNAFLSHTFWFALRLSVHAVHVPAGGRALSRPRRRARALGCGLLMMHVPHVFCRMFLSQRRLGVLRSASFVFSVWWHVDSLDNSRHGFRASQNWKCSLWGGTISPDLCQHSVLAHSSSNCRSGQILPSTPFFFLVFFYTVSSVPFRVSEQLRTCPRRTQSSHFHLLPSAQIFAV